MPRTQQEVHERVQRRLLVGALALENGATKMAKLSGLSLVSNKNFGTNKLECSSVLETEGLEW
jgi:hypothetical protein